MCEDSTVNTACVVYASMRTTGRLQVSWQSRLGCGRVGRVVWVVEVDRPDVHSTLLLCCVSVSTCLADFMLDAGVWRACRTRGKLVASVKAPLQQLLPLEQPQAGGLPWARASHVLQASFSDHLHCECPGVGVVVCC